MQAKPPSAPAVNPCPLTQHRWEQSSTGLGSGQEQQDPGETPEVMPGGFLLPESIFPSLRDSSHRIREPRVPGWRGPQGSPGPTFLGDGTVEPSWPSALASSVSQLTKAGDNCT